MGVRRVLMGYRSLAASADDFRVWHGLPSRLTIPRGCTSTAIARAILGGLARRVTVLWLAESALPANARRKIVIGKLTNPRRKDHFGDVRFVCHTRD